MIFLFQGLVYEAQHFDIVPSYPDPNIYIYIYICPVTKKSLRNVGIAVELEMIDYPPRDDMISRRN